MASPPPRSLSSLPVANASSSSSLYEYINMCAPPTPPGDSLSFTAASIITIVAASVTATATLILLFVIILNHRSRRYDAARNHLGEVDRHVRCTRTAALDESTNATGIAASAYRADEGVIGVHPAECSFASVSDVEALRIVPKLQSHGFHHSCIDAWLRSHADCPVCRSPAVAPSAPPMNLILKRPPSG